MASPHLLSQKARLTTEQLARMLQKHFPHGAPTEAAPQELQDLYRLWFEVDTLRFEHAGQINRADLLKEQLEDLQSRYWTLQMTKVPGGKV